MMLKNKMSLCRTASVKHGPSADT